MPHKMNTRSCERVNGLAVVLRGYLSMVGELAGDQWNEGDVSCSVVRRVALPDAFFAADGLFETFLTVLDEFGAFPAVIERELDRYLPFLATTKVLMAAVRDGVGREAAHEAIKEHAVAVALDMREQGAGRQRPVRPAGRRPAARADRGRARERWSPSRSRSPVPPSTRSRPSYAGSPRWPPGTPRPRRTRPAPSSKPAATLAAVPDMRTALSESREETYRRLYASHFDAVLGYALRRTDRPEDAADVTAETFLVAWRRLAHVPTGAGAPALAVRRRAPGARQPPSRRPPADRAR